MVALANSPSPTAVAMPAAVQRPSAPVTETALRPSVVVPAPVQLTLPKKADIQYDPEKMHAVLQEAISRLNDMVQRGGQGLSFSMDPKLGRPVVTVTNTQTGEVVRTIPNEVIIRLGHSIEDLKGLLHDQSL